MANPQIEDGYTKIANELLEAFSKHNFSAYETRVLMAIIRKTYGWNKKSDFISVSQIQEITDMDRRNVSRAKKSLINKNIIFIDGNFLGLNKDYDTWVSSKSTILNIIYRDTRPKWFPPPGYKYKKPSFGLCEVCFKEYDFHKTELNEHHIVPRSIGGSGCSANLITVCLPCHYKIHAHLKKLNIVDLDDTQIYYRQFMSKVSSKQTQFLSSIQTSTKERKKIKERKNGLSRAPFPKSKKDMNEHKEFIKGLRKEKKI